MDVEMEPPAKRAKHDDDGESEDVAVAPLIDSLPYALYEKSHYEMPGVREAVRPPDSAPPPLVSRLCAGLGSVCTACCFHPPSPGCLTILQILTVQAQAMINAEMGTFR